MNALFPHWTGHYSKQRRRIQFLFLGTFAVLPLFDLLRFDFAKSRLLILRQEIGLDEWALVWLFLMFAMWVIGAMSVVFGRVYCAYACPQMVFTELAHDIDAIAKRLSLRFNIKTRPRVARVISLTLIAAVSVTASLLLLAYFAPLPEVASRLLHLDVGPWIGLIGASVTLIAFLDFVFVREKFCQTACPYGLLQGVIEDGRSLHVKLDPEFGKCIDCGACHRVCPMGIDIRKGSFQIECTRCGSCIDSCEQVLGKLKQPRPSVLAFDFGGFSLRRWDPKRILVSVATLGFAASLLVAIILREGVTLRLSPVYMDEAATRGAVAGAPGVDVVESRYLLRATNHTKEAVELKGRVEGLPATTQLAGLEAAHLAPGEEKRFTLIVRIPRSDAGSGPTPFSWVIEGGGSPRRFSASFFARTTGRPS
jgi:cytochrome c oxidase accessory protein FixG